MKLAIISFAHMHAYSYAAALQQFPDVELVGVTDEDQQRGRAAAERYGTTYFSSMEELLALEELDGVMICNENVKHKQAVLAAARAGKHILCEKPIATTVEDAQEMIDVCDKYQVKLQIAFPVRFNEPVRQLKEMLERGELGEIVAVKGTNRGQNPGGWFVDPQLSGGGAVLDHTVHVIDLLRWMLKSEVKEVYAEVATRFYNIDVDDSGILIFEFENGVIASHDPSWSRPRTFPTWGDVTLEIIGTHGVVTLDAFAQHLHVYSDKENRFSEQFWGNDADLALVQDFIEMIREDREPSITGLDGLKAMQVAMAAYESAQKAEPIELLHK